MKWEYKVLWKNTQKDLEEEMNRMSSEGWELVNVSVGGSLGGAILIAAMKRQVKA